MTAALLFGVFFVLLLVGVPVAIALSAAALGAMLYIGTPLQLVPQIFFTSLDKFPILAVPFFILAGNLMDASGISQRILRLANALVGSVRGGLAMMSVLGAMMFACISGAGTAATAAIGSILIPAMIHKHYRASEAAALVACAGAIGVIIPPSIPMIIFGVVATQWNVSVGQMFIGGIIPGVLVGLALMSTAHISAVRHGYPAEERFAWADLWRAFKDALLALGMPVIILGGIFGGFVTPTEAAILAVVYSLVVGLFVYRTLRLEEFPRMFLDTAVLTSIATFLVAAATLFGWVLASEQIPQQIADFVITHIQSKVLILLVINVLLLFVGTFMENISAIIILVPILMPVAVGLGMHPLHFGVMMCFNLAIGMATPPVGVNLFIAGGIAKKNLLETARAAVPYVAAMIAVLMIVTFWPAASLWLPSLASAK